MSKSKGNVIDPLDADRRVRRRRAALHAGRDGRAGPRHQARRHARRRLSQFRHQAVERGALRRDERLRRACRASSRDDAKLTAQPLDRSARRRARRARSPRRSKAYRFNEAAERGLPLRLERLLRLVSRTRQAGAASARTRPPRPRRGHGGLGARRDPRAAASVHAVHHRGTVGGHGRRRRRPRRPARARPWPRLRSSRTRRPKPRSAG